MSSPRYRLLLSPRSPFARRVRIALLRLGIDFDLEWVDPFNPSAEFLAANPMGMVPVLITPSGQALPDSNLILQYLSDRHPLWPTEEPRRTRSQIASTLAVGVMTAGVAIFMDTHHRKDPDAFWMDDNHAVITRSLARIDELERELPVSHLFDNTLSQAGLDIGSALEYLDFRLPQIKWRESHPGLAGVLEMCRKDPAFVETVPKQNP